MAKNEDMTLAEAQAADKELVSGTSSTPSKDVSGATSQSAAEDPAAATPEGGAGTAGEASGAGTEEAQDLSGGLDGNIVAGDDNAAGGESEGASEEGTDVSDVPKTHLVEEVIVEAGPLGPNGCLTDEECMRPAHPATPYGHAHGLETTPIA